MEVILNDREGETVKSDLLLRGWSGGTGSTVMEWWYTSVYHISIRVHADKWSGVFCPQLRMEDSYAPLRYP